MLRTSKFLDSRAIKFLRFVPTLFLFSIHFLNYLMNPDGVEHADSHTYGYNEKESSDPKIGLRSPLVILIYSTLAKAESIILFQHLLAASASSYFVFVATSSLSGRARLIVQLLLATFFTIPAIISWHSVLLTESISTSLLIFITSLVLRLRETRSNTLKLLLLFLVALWVLVKTSNGLVLSLILILTMVVILLNVSGKGRFLNQRNKSVLFGIMVLSTLSISFLIEEQGDADFGGLSYETVSAVLKISNQNPSAASLLSELPDDALICLDQDVPRDFFENLEKLRKGCNQDNSFFKEEFRVWYLKVAVTRPDIVLNMFGHSLVSSTSPISYYGSAISTSPQFFEDFFFGARNVAMRDTGMKFDSGVVDFLLIYSPVFNWIAIYLIFLFGSRKMYSAILIQTFCLLAILLISYLSPNEWFRQNTPFLTIFYALGLLSLIDLILSVTQKNKSGLNLTNRVIG